MLSDASLPPDRRTHRWFGGPTIHWVIDMKQTDSPSSLDTALKAEITKCLSNYRDSICANYEEAHQSFLDILEPFWDRQMKVNEEVERYYYGSVGNRSALQASHLVTDIMSMLVPVFMRPERFLHEMPEEAKDQLANQHVNYNLSRLTGAPFALLMPTQLDELGKVGEIFDMIVSGPDGEPFLTQWATPAIMALQDEGVDIPEELAQLIALPDSLT